MHFMTQLPSNMHIQMDRLKLTYWENFKALIFTSLLFLRNLVWLNDMQLGSCTSSTTFLNTGTPQGCELSLILFTLHRSLHPHPHLHLHYKSCWWHHGSWTGLRQREGGLQTWRTINYAHLSEWHGETNFRPQRQRICRFKGTPRTNHFPHQSNSDLVEILENLNISNHLTWTSNTACLGKQTINQSI